MGTLTQKRKEKKKERKGVVAEAVVVVHRSLTESPRPLASPSIINFPTSQHGTIHQQIPLVHPMAVLLHDGVHIVRDTSQWSARGLPGTEKSLE